MQEDLHPIGINVALLPIPLLEAGLHFPRHLEESVRYGDLSQVDGLQIGGYLVARSTPTACWGLKDTRFKLVKPRFGFGIGFVSVNEDWVEQ